MSNLFDVEDTNEEVVSSTHPNPTPNRNDIRVHANTNISGAPKGAPYVPNLIDRIRGFRQTTTLSSEGTEYLKKIHTQFKERRETVDSISTTGQIECALFYDTTTKHGILLGFEETMAFVAGDRNPVILMEDAVRELTNQGYTVRDRIVVPKSAYDRVSNMYTLLKMRFDSYRPECTITLADLMKDGVFLVDSSINNILDILNNYSAIGKPLPAMDFGVTVSLALEKDKNQAQAIAVVTGKFGVEYVGSEHLLKPYVRLTGVETPFFQEPGLIAVALAIATNKLCIKSGWRRPFMELSEHAPNLGMYQTITQKDGTVAPLRHKTTDEVEVFICDRMVAYDGTPPMPIGQGVNPTANLHRSSRIIPIPLIDVAVGRAQAGLIDMVTSDNTNRINTLTKIARFCGMTEVTEVIASHVPCGNEYYGTIEMNGVPVDSRQIGYLEAVQTASANDPLIKRLNCLSDDPAFRSDVIKKLYKDYYKSTGVCKTYILNDKFITQVMAMVSNKVIDIEDQSLTVSYTSSLSNANFSYDGMSAIGGFQPVGGRGLNYNIVV